MKDFKIKLGENGRIVIPIYYRKQLQLETGDELIIHLKNKELHLVSLKQAIKKVQNLVKKYTKDKSLVDELKSLRSELITD